MNKLYICFFLTILILCAAAGVSAVEFTNGNVTLNIPDEIAQQLVVETPENDADGILFTISEKLSIEIAEKQGLTWNGVGWLFSIRRVDEDTLHEMLCYNMFGSRVFARDQKGDIYLYDGPTDVRMVRDDYNDPKNYEVWGALNEWARSVPETIIADNYGFTPEKYGNTELDIMIARALYMEGTKYTVSTTEFGPLEAQDFEGSEAFLRKLSENVEFQYVYSNGGEKPEAPDGEYVVLNFPDDDYRFDFFLLDGSENVIRQVWFNGQYDSLYNAVFEDETLKASEIMLDFYHALAEAAGLASPAK